MEDGRNALRFGSYFLVGLLILSSISVNIQAQTTSGFVSIDCGATSAYSDAVTSIPWEPDSQYTNTGLSGEVPFSVGLSLDNSNALQTFRYFPDGRDKHCYELQTTRANVSFLLRAMFLQGSAPELTLPIEFDVSVNGTICYYVKYNVYDADDILTTPVVYEGLFYSPGSLTHVCLLTKTGAPFISSLELRQLDNDGKMYSRNGTFAGNPGQYLTNLRRLNLGAAIGSTSIRYPDDPYDRLWRSPGSWSSTDFDAEGVVSSTTSAATNYVPPAVMQYVWMNDTANSSFWVAFSSFPSQISEVYIAVFFEEIESNSVIGDRVFTMNMNGDLSTVTAKNVPQMVNYWNWPVPNESTNFTFEALPTSVLGPIVNAIEVYAEFSFNQSATAVNDGIIFHVYLGKAWALPFPKLIYLVEKHEFSTEEFLFKTEITKSATESSPLFEMSLDCPLDELTALKASFNLTDWQGDPCYPVSWEWVSCTTDTPARVEKLLLSSMGIYASIPPSVSNLDALTEIHLNNNSLYGQIPDSLVSLQSLLFLYLNDNQLSGQIPPGLIQKLGANFDYSGNSLLVGSPSSSTPTTKKSTNIGVIIGAIVGGVCVLLIGSGILLWYFYWKKKTQNQGDNSISAKLPPSRPASAVQLQTHHSDAVDTSSGSRPPLVLQATEIGQVSFETVVTATNNFSVEVGKGSYGSVFHGRLDNREVAVKRNNLQTVQGRNEFTTEVDILTRVHHRNLVSLIAYCDEGEERILIYEYQQNGTLREWLQGTRGTLDWKQRLKIAADSARGLEYLHKGCDPTIIHRDVKSNNILLDESMSAKVGDFGLSKATPGSQTSVFSGLYSTGVKGTPGYLDPEYYHLEKLTPKSDVYSFGVVLAEIITGLPPLGLNPNGGAPLLLVDQVRKLVERNDIDSLADPKLQGMYHTESMWRMADVALSCVEAKGVKRLDFTQAVTGIVEAIELEKTFKMHSPLPTPSRSFLRSNSSTRGYQTCPDKSGYYS
ncbi:unnamed protein product [Calypogeia fissa]